LDAFIVTLREGFEATLILGLIFAYLSKTGQSANYGRPVWLGTFGALVASVSIGGVLYLAVGELEGTSEKVFEGTATVMAASVLTWMVFWMRRQSRTIGGHLRSQVGDAIATGNVLALTGVAFVAVAREGVETALFLFAATKESGAVTTVIGGAAGVIVAIGLGVLFYRGAITIDLKKFFAITGMLVILLAAYLLFIGMHEFAEASGGDALELLAPLAAILYGGAFSHLFLRGLRRPATQ
jgi:high-affinity iron transporter